MTRTHNNNDYERKEKHISIDKKKNKKAAKTTIKNMERRKSVKQ